MKYYVVETDNFGGDYPDERIVGAAYATRAEAQAEADRMNDGREYAPRYYKVVEEGYKLQPGFEP